MHRRYAKGVAAIVAGVLGIAATLSLNVPWLSDPTNAAALTGALSSLLVIFGPKNAD